jgi:hypothetical protein
MYDSRVKMRSMPADVQVVRIDRCADAHVAASHPMMSALSSPQNVKTSIGHVPFKGQINTYCIHRNNPPNQPRLWHSTAHTVAHDYKDVVATLLPQEHGMYGGWLAGLEGAAFATGRPAGVFPPLLRARKIWIKTREIQRKTDGSFASSLSS